MSRIERQTEFDINPPNWNQIPALKLLEIPQLASKFSIQCSTHVGDLHLSLNEFGLRITSAPVRGNHYDLLLNQPVVDELQLSNFTNSSVVESSRYHLEIMHNPLSFRLSDRTGNLILQSCTDAHFEREHRVPAFAKTSQGWLISIALKSSEAIYGLGEKWGALNKRGQIIRSYNHDALGVNAEISYKNTPFSWSPDGWGIFLNTPAPVTHAVGYAPWSQRNYSVLLEDESLDVFLFAEPKAKSEGKAINHAANIIGYYTQLTGRAPVPPRWSAGVILSKAYYQDAEEIIAVAEEVRKREMPCDVITFDGRAWQDTDTRFAFEWCSKRYPDPVKVIEKLKALNFKICVWEYPLISVEHAWFKEFADKGWLIKDKRTGEAYQYDWDQQAFGKVLTPLPRSGIIDFTHPDAYAFWRDAHKSLFDDGVDMIKADFGEQVEDDNMLAYNGESGKALHNVYAHLYNRCVYEAAEMYSKSGAFLFSRSAWIGSQRFNSQWGGDPQADWEGMISNIRGGISWGLSGAPFYATDVGGFYRDTRDDKLYVRWSQAAVFSAHFRFHGIGAREPWSYSDEANTAVTKAVHLRYRLLAYIEKCYQQASETGLPVQRAMVLAFPHEKQSWAFENQFMFGADLLVVPCFTPEDEVEFYLPEGEWLQFDIDAEFSSEVLIGQRVYKKPLALDEIAVFVRKDARIPLCKLVQYSDEFNNENIPTEMWSPRL